MKLSALDCSGTNIKQLDLSANKKLQQLTCSASLVGNIKFDHKIPRFAVAVYAKKQGDNYLFNLADTGIAADKIKDVKDISNTKIGETANLPAGVKFSASKAQLQVPGEKMESFDLVSLQQPESQENRPNSAKLVYQVAQHKTAAAAERGNSGKAPAGGKKLLIYIIAFLLVVVIVGAYYISSSVIKRNRK